MAPSQGPRVCVIGAGSSGIASAHALDARGIEFDCYERGSHVGGNWRIDNDNGLSSAYDSLFTISSRRMTEYAAFPMPESFPDYQHHSQLAAYFDAYVDHFGLREKITFRTEVVRVERAEEGGWNVTVRPFAGDGDGAEETKHYDAVMVANGHHWDPRWPEPAFPGEFDGDIVHAHDYRNAEGYEGKRVLVLGIGNSACDIAVETSRVSERTFLAMRRGAWIVPKYIGSTPIDEVSPSWAWRLPFAVQRTALGLLIKRTQGHPTDFGLPKPDHRIAEAHPTVSADLLHWVGHGRIAVKPNIERLEGDSVRFVDGTVERIDKIVYCTGYKINFPFFDEKLLDPSEDNRIELYRNVVHPDLEGLYFIGLIQVLGSVIPLAEAQADWIADVVAGNLALPGRGEMVSAIAADQAALRKRYVASKRHTIQVDHQHYLHQIAEERKSPA